MRQAVFLVAVLLVIPAVAPAQETTGRIEGRVLDPEGNPVAYVSVSVTGPSVSGARGSVSTASGHFRVVGLPVGIYEVRLKHISYRELVIEAVRVSLGSTTSMSQIRLEPQTIEMEPIIVEGRQLIDMKSTEVGGAISSDVLDQLPTQRDHLDAATYLPHAERSFFGDGLNIAGSTGAENAYFIDGMNVTDPYRATGSMALPQSFIRAIEVKAGGYQAEYGRSSGGIVNVVTHSGTNEFRGQAFGFFTNNNFSNGYRVGYLDPDLDDFARYDLGGSVAGPIVRDRLWYFAAYDPRIESRDLQYPGLEVLGDRATKHSFAGKLDWHPNAETRLSLTLLGDPESRDRVGTQTFIGGLVPTSVANPEVVLSTEKTGSVSLGMEGQRTFGNRGIVEGRIYRVGRRWEMAAATDLGRQEPLNLDIRTGVDLSGGYGFVHDYSTTRTGASLKGSLFGNSHVLKFGVEYEDISLGSEASLLTPDGRPGLVVQRPDSPNFDPFRGITFNMDQTNGLRLPSVFVQDSWSVTDQLQLNGGVRWDGVYISDYSGRTAQQITDQFQPRAGFAYRIGDTRTQKVFGSVGRFYQQLSFNAITLHFGDYEQHLIDYATNPAEVPADTVSIVDVDAKIAPPADDLKGPHFDELVLGYERAMGRSGVIAVRGIYRTLRVAVEDSFTPEGLLQLGNPGRGELSNVPEPKRDYTALELSFQKQWPSSMIGTSYVLSRNYGNYPGAFPTDNLEVQPHRSESFFYPEQYAGDGPLPNDRTHSFKLHGYHAFSFGLSAGGFLNWRSGTPLSDMARMYFGDTQLRPYPADGFLKERGSEGRLPSLWDVNLRFAYDLPSVLGTRGHSRLLLDIFHLFSPREPTSVNQIRLSPYFPETGQGSPNPVFGEVIAYQPPMTIRLGIEANF